MFVHKLLSGVLPIISSTDNTDVLHAMCHWLSYLSTDFYLVIMPVISDTNIPPSKCHWLSCLSIGFYLVYCQLFMIQMFLHDSSGRRMTLKETLQMVDSSMEDHGSNRARTWRGMEQSRRYGIRLWCKQTEFILQLTLYGFLQVWNRIKCWI